VSTNELCGNSVSDEVVLTASINDSIDRKCRDTLKENNGINKHRPVGGIMIRVDQLM
jgi:hypothetical protein